VWVCTTNDALEDVVLHAVAPHQRQQLVFVQNGMLLPWLATHGLQHNTQVLLYMSGELQIKCIKQQASWHVQLQHKLCPCILYTDCTASSDPAVIHAPLLLPVCTAACQNSGSMVHAPASYLLLCAYPSKQRCLA
jgi:hypothetical protein